MCGGSVPVFGGLSPRPDRVWPASSTSTRRRSWPTSAPGTFGPDLEAALRGPGSGLHPRPLAPVDGHLDGRRLARLPRRRPVLDPLREDRGHGRRPRGRAGRRHGRAHRRGRRPGPPPGRTSPSCSSAARARSGCITAARLRVPPEAGRPRPGGPSASPASPTGLDACRRILRRGATPAVLRLYDETESRRNFDRRDLRPRRPRRGRPRGARRHHRDRRRGVRGRPTRLDDALVDRWLHERNDTSALGPLWRAGIVVDTVEVAGRWSVLPALWPTRSSPRSRGSRARSSPRSTSPTPTPTAPASTSPSPDAGRPRRRRRRRPSSPGRRPTTGGPGTPSPRSSSRTAPRSATTTASASTAAGSWPTPSARPSRCCGRSRAPSTPTGHPQPGQARPPLAVRPAALAVSDAARRRRRHLGGAGGHRGRRRRRRARAPGRGAAVDAGPRTGRGRRGPHRRRGAGDRGGGPVGRRRTGRRGRDRQPAGHDRRVGAPHRDTGRSRPRLAGPAHRRAPASPCRPTGSASRPTRRRPSWPRSSTRSTPGASAGRRGAVLRDDRHLGGLDPERRARCTSPTPPTPR